MEVPAVHVSAVEDMGVEEVCGPRAEQPHNGPRMAAQRVVCLTDRAAEELREHLRKRFRIAVRVREVGEGRGYRLFQARKSGNRHLVDVRPVETLPSTQRIGEVLVIAPADLIAGKVIAYHQRRGRPKSGTDWRDLAMLLLTFPELKRDPGPVRDCLLAAGADPPVIAVWEEFVAQPIQPADEEGEF